MSRTYTIIDFKIIWKKIHHQISDEEQKRLNQWLEESADHRKFYESVKHFYSEGSSFQNKKEEIDRAWKNFNRKTSFTGSNFSRLVAYASFLLLGALITTAIYFLLPESTEQPLAVAETETTIIQPGSSKAMLILENGEMHQLYENREEIFSEGGSQIKNTGNKIEYISGNEKSGQKEKEVKYHTLKIPRGGEYFLVLSDGTKVWLNSETSLRYPVHFPEDKREVELTGEAYFEVSENRNSPFLVSSGEQRVKVLGTKFNISSFLDDHVVLTTLVEGKVEVSLKDSPEVKQMLLPNEQGRFDKEEGKLTKAVVNPYAFIAWKEGRFVFDDERLSGIMKTLSKWYDVDIVFASEEALDYRFTGNLRRYDSFEKILNKIEKTNEVKFIIQGRQIIVK